jgi:hypothetical protein
MARGTFRKHLWCEAAKPQVEGPVCSEREAVKRVRSTTTEVAVPRFRTKAREIEAVQWMGNDQSWQEMLAFVAGSGLMFFRKPEGTLDVPTMSGRMLAQKGDWIIKDDGLFALISAEEFARLYEPVR